MSGKTSIEIDGVYDFIDLSEFLPEKFRRAIIKM